MFNHDKNNYSYVIKHYLACLAMITLSVSCFAGSTFEQTRRTVKIEEKTPSEFAGRLSRLYGIPVCVEETSPAVFSLAETNASLGDILDVFVHEFAAYCWTYDSTNGVVNVFPKQNAPADWVCQVRDNTNMPLIAIVEHDYLGLRDRGISLMYPKVSERYSLALCSGPQEFRKLLNGLCIQSPWCSNWVITRAKPGARFWESAKRPVLFDLKFEGYRVYLQMTVCFRGVESTLKEETVSRDAMKFKVDLSDGEMKASRLLEQGEEIGGLRLVEYKKADDRLVFQRDEFKMELANGESRTYQMLGFDLVKKWLSAPDAVPFVNTNQTPRQASADIERLRNTLIQVRALMLKYAQKFPAGSEKRQVVERQIKSVEAQITNSPSSSGRHFK